VGKELPPFKFFRGELSLIIMALPKIIPAEGFFKYRNPDWNKALGTLYRVSDELGSRQIRTYDSLRITVGDAEGVYKKSLHQLKCLQLMQRLGLDYTPDRSPEIPIESSKAFDFLISMASKMWDEEVEGVLMVDGNYLLVSKGTRLLPIDTDILSDLKRGNPEEGGSSSALALASFIFDDVAGYKISKNGARMTEYVEGNKSLVYNPNNRKVRVYTSIKARGADDDGNFKRATLMVVEREGGMVTPFDFNGQPRRRKRKLKDYEAAVFYPL
jgi:hypothetical protein